MKYPGGHQSTVFVEQVGTVTALFDQWNDCERTVVLYALLKRLPFPNLKFLQLSIEYNIAQNINNSSSNHSNNSSSHSSFSSNNSSSKFGGGSSGNGGGNFNKFHLLESNSNNGIFLTKLISVYKNFRIAPPVMDMGQPPPPTPPQVYGIGNVPYETREDILNDILTYLPLLKPGNEEAKAAYISLVPLVVSDSIKQLIPTEMVQQILSYLLIHPAVTSEDRRALAQWLHHLEEHINSSYIDSMVGSATTPLPTPTSVPPPQIQPQTLLSSAGIPNSHPIQTQKMRSFSLIPTTTTSANSAGKGGPFASIHEAGVLATSATTGACWDTNNNNNNNSSSGNSHPSVRSKSLHERPHPNLLWTTDLPQGQGQGLAKQEYICDDQVIREFRKTIGRNMDTSQSGGLLPALKSSSSSSCCKSSVSSVSSVASSSSCTSSSSSSVSSSSSSTSSISSSGKGTTLATSAANSTNSASSSNNSSGHNVSAGDAVFVVVPEQNEDLHVSFSKNGTEILDFDCDDDNKSNTQIAFEAPPPPITARMVAESASSYLLSVPGQLHQLQQHHSHNHNHPQVQQHLDALLQSSSNALKTRRSNSLTTAPVTMPGYPGSGSGGGGGGLGGSHPFGTSSSSSTENLLQLKPRSYSLSIENHRGGASLMSCGSDTRLEEMKPAGMLGKMCGGGMGGVGGGGGIVGGIGGSGGGGGNPGMNCIGQWLKSLRLHKYVWLFSNITYEQMLEISEEYLANLSVTKGARHKLVLCIQKLRERGAVLAQMEQTLLAGDAGHVVAPMLEELTNIVLTPMKPIDPFSKDNIAGQFIKVIEILGSILVSRSMQPGGTSSASATTDEEQVTTFLWILERALHNEAFLGQMNLLKELKFKVSKIKLQFVNKPHFGAKGAVPGSGVPVTSGGGGGVTGSGPSVVGAPGTNIVNKNRWTTATGTTSSTVASVPSKNSAKLPGMERKNSGASLPSFSAMLQQPPPQTPGQQQQQQQKANGQQSQGVLQSTAPPQQYNSKSSSYPSFSQNLKFTNAPPPPVPLSSVTSVNPQQQQLLGLSKGLSGGKGSSHQQQLQKQSLGGSGGPVGVMYHRHSMNSLMTSGGGTGGVSQRSAVPQLLQMQKAENNENVDIGNHPLLQQQQQLQQQSLNSQGNQQQQQQQQCKDKNNICDINSRLEFLCLQMTEQAIN